MAWFGKDRADMLSVERGMADLSYIANSAGSSAGGSNGCCSDSTIKGESSLLRQSARAHNCRQVVYDLAQLPRESVLPLRDSLLQSLSHFTNTAAPAGSRAITTQLCLALADLAYQLPEWKDVIAGMVDSFGSRVESVEMLLEFLKVLVEEAGNSRIPLSVSLDAGFSQGYGAEA